MEDDIRANYFAIIPAYIRYNKVLKFGERLMKLVKVQYLGGFHI